MDPNNTHEVIFWDNLYKLRPWLYINTCRYSWEKKDITIVLELYMSKRNWKNI